MSITIFLVDEYDTIRTLLRMLLETQRDLVVVGEATDGLSAVSTVTLCQPDVVVLDLVSPMHRSLAVAQHIRARCPSAQVILLALYMSLEDIRQALGVGVQGFVFKEAIGDELIEATRTVHAGERYLSCKLVEYGMDSLVLIQ
jgi:DNA-binding NarL/FixJ family response regulator